jgi:AI-2 transport protein TqsA
LNSYEKTQTICQVIIASAIVLTCIYWFRSVLMPFALAGFLALNLSKLIDLQTRHLKFPRGLAVGMTFLLGIALVIVLSFVISASVSDLANKSDLYIQGFNDMWTSASETVNEIPGWEEVQSRFGINPDELTSRVTGSITSGVGAIVASLTGNIFNLLSEFLVVAMFLGFMLAGGETREEPKAGVWGEIEAQIKQYVAAKTVLSAMTGTLVAICLNLIGLDLAIVFGLLAFVLNFIPNVGSLISTALPLPLVLFSPGLTFTQRVLAIAIPGLIQFAIGNILEPKLLGDSLDLHPVVILLTLMIWGALWGGVGMFLATPITSMMKIFFEKLESTRPLALLLAGRPSAMFGLETPETDKEVETTQDESASDTGEPSETR